MSSLSSRFHANSCDRSAAIPFAFSASYRVATCFDVTISPTYSPTSVSSWIVRVANAPKPLPGDDFMMIPASAFSPFSSTSGVNAEARMSELRRTPRPTKRGDAVNEPTSGSSSSAATARLNLLMLQLSELTTWISASREVAHTSTMIRPSRVAFLRVFSCF